MRSFVPIGVIVLLSGGLALIVSYLWHRQENTENSSTSDFPTLEDDWVVENLHWGNDQKNGLGLKFVNSMSLDWHDFLMKLLKIGMLRRLCFLLRHRTDC